MQERGVGGGQFGRSILNFRFQEVAGFLQRLFLAFQLPDACGVQTRQHNANQAAIQCIKPKRVDKNEAVARE